MKQEINAFNYAKEIMQALPAGVLLTTKNGGKVNSMVIGWGHLGIVWGKPVFIAYVREGRFTREQLDANGEFTINIPYGDYDKKIIGYCGSRSGRNVDKVKDLGLTLVDGDAVSVPAVKELPLTLECKVIYRQLQDKESIPADVMAKMYPQDVDSTNPMANKDLHFAYYGEIVKAYIVKD